MKMLNIDGFITTLAKTDFHSSNELMHEKVLNPEGAEFKLEAYINFKYLYPNHCRRFIGHIIRDELAADLIECNRQNGDPTERLKSFYMGGEFWLTDMLFGKLKEKGIRVIPWRTLELRLSQCKANKEHRSLGNFLVMIVGSIWQAVVLCGVYYYIKFRKVNFVWKNSVNERVAEEKT